jgi:hypothetical protein
MAFEIAEVRAEGAAAGRKLCERAELSVLDFQGIVARQHLEASCAHPRAAKEHLLIIDEDSIMAIQIPYSHLLIPTIQAIRMARLRYAIRAIKIIHPRPIASSSTMHKIRVYSAIHLIHPARNHAMQSDACASARRWHPLDHLGEQNMLSCGQSNRSRRAW